MSQDVPDDSEHSPDDDAPVTADSEPDEDSASPIEEEPAPDEDTDTDTELFTMKRVLPTKITLFRQMKMTFLKMKTKTAVRAESLRILTVKRFRSGSLPAISRAATTSPTIPVTE